MTEEKTSVGTAPTGMSPGAGRAGKTVAIVQSNYIPWKGYFDLIRAAQEFVFFDDVQYTRRDWRNRNRIKTKDGPLWLSIPVESRGKYTAAIRDMVVSNGQWARRHWKTIVASYSRAPHFRMYEALFAELYLNCRETYLVDINYRFISAICGILGVSTRLSRSSDYPQEHGRSERLIGLCQQLGATRYLSGPSAREYLDRGAFVNAGLEVRFADYSGYPEYSQLYPPFLHEVSVIDLLFNAGPDAGRYLQNL